jgi:aspartate aminotransferase
MTEKHHIFMTKDGRISMAGLSGAKIPKLAGAIKDAILNVPSGKI